MTTFHKIYGPARPGIASRAKLPPLVQGSRDTLYLAWLNLDGTPFDLSGASAITATFYREHAASTVYAADGTFAVTSAADGQLTWALGAGDVGQAGTFYFFIEAVIGGLPVVAGPVQVEVVANPDATAVAPEMVTGVSAAEAAYLAALVAAIPDAADVASLDDIGGGVTATAAVYVAAYGSDANDGLSANAPKLTIGAAMTAASALLTAGADGVLVDVLDGETYTETVTVPESVHLRATAATLVGALTLDGECTAELNQHYASANNQNLINKTGGSGHGIYRANVVDGRGVAGTLTGVQCVRNVSNGSILFAFVGVVYVPADGIGIGDGATGFGHIHFWTPDLYLAGNNAVGIRAANNSTFIGYIDHVLEIGTPTGTVGIQLSSASARVVATISETIADTAYSITNGDLYLVCARLVGTRTGTPVSEISDLALADLETTAGAQAKADVAQAAAEAASVPKDAAFVTTATDYTTLAGDEAKEVLISGAATVTLTDGLDSGFQQVLSRVGSGAVSIVAATTLRKLTDGTGYETIASATLATTAVVRHLGSNVWLITGDFS